MKPVKTAASPRSTSVNGRKPTNPNTRLFDMARAARANGDTRAVQLLEAAALGRPLRRRQPTPRGGR